VMIVPVPLRFDAFPLRNIAGHSRSDSEDATIVAYGRNGQRDVKPGPVFSHPHGLIVLTLRSQYLS